MNELDKIVSNDGLGDVTVTIDPTETEGVDAGSAGASERGSETQVGASGNNGSGETATGSASATTGKGEPLSIRLGRVGDDGDLVFTVQDSEGVLREFTVGTDELRAGDTDTGLSYIQGVIAKAAESYGLTVSFDGTEGVVYGSGDETGGNREVARIQLSKVGDDGALVFSVKDGNGVVTELTIGADALRIGGIETGSSYIDGLIDRAIESYGGTVSFDGTEGVVPGSGEQISLLGAQTSGLADMF